MRTIAQNDAIVLRLICISNQTLDLLVDPFKLKWFSMQDKSPCPQCTMHTWADQFRFHAISVGKQPYTNTIRTVHLEHRT